MPRPLFTPEKDPVPIVQEAGWAPGPVCTGAENLALAGIRSPDRSACNQSLYRLSYPGPRVGRGGRIMQISGWTKYNEKKQHGKPERMKVN